MGKKNQNESMEAAGRSFYTGDYKKSDPVSSGFATTHEQISDTYAEGTIDDALDLEGAQE
jgi:hypothetical protein